MRWSATARSQVPGLKVAVVENGSSWVAAAREPGRRLQEAPQGFSEHPVDTIKRNLYISPFWEEDLGALAELVGEEHVLFGSDYPHPEGLADPASYTKQPRVCPTSGSARSWVRTSPAHAGAGRGLTAAPAKPCSITWIAASTRPDLRGSDEGLDDREEDDGVDVDVAEGPSLHVPGDPPATPIEGCGPVAPHRVLDASAHTLITAPSCVHRVVAAEPAP